MNKILFYLRAPGISFFAGVFAVGSAFLGWGIPSAFAQSSTDVKVDNVGADQSPPPATDDSSNVSGATLKPLKTFEENPDITDARLRAEAGSLEVVSLRASMFYQGPSPSDFGALDLPNPDHVAGRTATQLSGNVGARYRIDSKSSISLYAGVSDLYAFHPQQALDVNSPSISYDRAFRAFGVQCLTGPRLTWITARDYKKLGEFGAAGYGLQTVYNIGQSRFAFGTNTNASYSFFSRDYVRSDGRVVRLSMSISPMLKYNCTDKLSIDTDTHFALSNFRQTASLTQLESRHMSQSVGVGYAVTRDIFVQPFLEFYPTQARLNETTLNFSGTISVL